MPENGDVSVPLDPRLRRWVDQRIREGGYRDAGEYINELIERDLSLVSEDEINRQLEEAIASGPAQPADADFWGRIRRKFADRIADRER